jgi:hypothetical protein
MWQEKDCLLLQNPSGFFDIRGVIKSRGEEELRSNSSISDWIKKKERENPSGLPGIRGNYSLPNLFRSVKPTPKKRNAPTTQMDHVTVWFWYTSIPIKKIQNIAMTAMPYHHFFSPLPFMASFTILIVSEHVVSAG